MCVDVCVGVEESVCVDGGVALFILFALFTSLFLLLLLLLPMLFLLILSFLFLLHIEGRSEGAVEWAHSVSSVVARRTRGCVVDCR